MITTWMKGVVVYRWRQLLLAAAGLAMATAIVGVIGTFAISSGETMTRRALTNVPVDWQIAVAPGTDTAALMSKLLASPSAKSARVVAYADVSGFDATTGGTSQRTGAGQVLGVPDDYAATFPGQIRLLQGSAQGVLIAQQTAANLHVSVGDTVSVMRPGLDPVPVKLDGVVDLPNADAMFQTIGPQKGPSATAPPDDVILLPMDRWMALFSDAARTQGGGARLQVHAALDHSSLPTSPDAAFIYAASLAKNFELRAAGAAQVGDNLAARLGAVRQDALFARVLLLFLGLPGVVLATLLTVAIVRTQAARRRREQALLGLRGASTLEVARLATAESGVLAVLGALGGMLLAALLSTAAFGARLTSPAVIAWLWITFAVAMLLALACVLVPTLVELRSNNVAARRAMLPRNSTPLWHRIYLDLGLLLLAAALFWRVAGTGYQIVLAPEGVAATSVDYTAFLAPLCFWAGAGLLVLRLATRGLAKQRHALATVLKPFSARLSDPIAATMSRQGSRIAGGIALATLAFAFATSTAVFDATYNAQALVDAQLTNGADVTVTGTRTSPAADRIDLVRRQTGVAAAEPMQHRYAYVGNDLQDLYGIDPAAIGRATNVSDAYFADHDARGTLARLAKTPDGVLVSQETVNDFQLALGDTVNLRLQTGADRQYRAVPFRFVGVVSEFPTAPHDSFLVANAAYVAARTGDPHAEIVLVRTSSDSAEVRAGVQAALGTASPLKVTDVSQTSRTIGSSLTAVDLGALSRIELVFAIVLASGSTGLMLWLGLGERQRSAAILAALGATSADIRRFAQAEAALILAGGAICGFLLGEAVAAVLVKLLTGVFDPPPEALQQPWSYLLLVLAAVSAALWVAARQRRPEGLDARIS